MQKNIVVLAATLAAVIFFTSNASADKYKERYYEQNHGYYDNNTQNQYYEHNNRKHKKKRGAMDINLAAVPASINGTYEIDRFVIKEGDKIILDSDNDFAVADDQGYLTINMTVGKEIILDMVYNMQMVGPAFQNPELQKYNFIYDKKTFKIPHVEGSPISTALSSIGMTVYDHEDIYWEIPLENGKKLFMKIEKESDIIMQLTDKPYYNQY